MAVVAGAASLSSDARKPRTIIVPETGSVLLGEGLSVCADAQYFDCGAVELAEKLVGDYLWVSSADIVVRIIETEAYPKADTHVYARTFSDIEAAKLSQLKPGDVVLFETVYSRRICVNVPFVYIVAAGGDLVMVRAFEAVHGHKNIKIRRGGQQTAAKLIMDGPMKAASIFKDDMEEGVGEPLHSQERFQLYLNAAVFPKQKGPRVMEKLMAERDGTTAGNQNKFRFTAQFYMDGTTAPKYANTYTGDLEPLV